ncbi:MarC family protein [Streptococcus catagoni]|uniref:MarC family protein n=1 Tax=Streptococcus catagoni TaxID=2654874 RepID=UPI001408F0CA|nr:MarC family protein [Streptococcus catagoni]
MLSKFVLIFMAFFAIMNPLSNLPAYIALVADDDQNISKKIARKSLIIAFVIIALVTLSGQFIFTLFGITIDALRIAGGILVALTGYHMINGIHSPGSKNIEHATPNDPMSIATSPLAMPLFAGPGTIATAITLSEGKFENQVLTLLAFFLLCLLTYLLLLSAKPIANFLGKNIMSIITRMMGLILTTIGIQMLLLGIRGAFKLN